tara:strand:- start:4270 stop:4746 length:477 start_codon:yes stop_codon:yes gene_type:complete
MKITPHRAFGYVTCKSTWESGETYQYNYPEGRMWWNLFTAGSMINNKFSDGTSLPDYHAGDWTGPSDAGKYGICNQTPVDCEMWCVSAEDNNNYLPDCEKWELASGSSVTLPVGTKLMFVKGSITLNGKTIDNPTQIKVVTADATVVASEQCYGIKFL